MLCRRPVIDRLTSTVASARKHNGAASKEERNEACGNHNELAEHVFLQRIVDQIIIDLTARLIEP